MLFEEILKHLSLLQNTKTGVSNLLLTKSIHKYTKVDKECSSPSRSQSTESMLCEVGDDQHVAPSLLRNNLVDSIFIHNRDLSLERKV